MKSEVVYLGDDINDLANICSVGWGMCPNDAIDEVKQRADFTLNSNGGTLAIREVCNFIIRFNQRF